MEYVLYADILFFINFSMDLITLYLTSRLTSGPPLSLRYTAAAAIGGIYGTLAVAAGISGIAGVITAGIVSVVMVLTAFGRAAAPIVFRRSAVFWGFAALLGGVMTALCSFGDFGAPGTNGGGTAVLFAGSTLCLVIARAFTHLRRRKTVRIRVSVDGNQAEFDALLDSGNLLTDPLSAKPVIIADRSVLGNTIPSPGGSLERRIRMIPVKGIGGKDLLTGFVPDSVTIITNNKKSSTDAVIAVTDSGSDFFGGYPANIPAILV